MSPLLVLEGRERVISSLGTGVALWCSQHNSQGRTVELTNRKRGNQNYRL